MSRLKDICIDCHDPWAMAPWWADVLGYRVRPHTDEDMAKLREAGFAGPEEDPSIALDPVDEAGPGVWLVKVPEPKTMKNRVHLDVYGDVDVLLAKGAPWSSGWSTGPCWRIQRGTSSASSKGGPTRSESVRIGDTDRTGGLSARVAWRAPDRRHRRHHQRSRSRL